MSIGMGISIPNLASLPGSSRPGGGGSEPLSLLKFDTTLTPVEKGEACEAAYEGTFFYKEAVGLVATGNTIYIDVEGTQLADPGFYKAVFEGVPYEYDIKASGIVGDVNSCE